MVRKEALSACLRAPALPSIGRRRSQPAHPACCWADSPSGDITPAGSSPRFSELTGSTAARPKKGRLVRARHARCRSPFASSATPRTGRGRSRLPGARSTESTSASGNTPEIAQLEKRADRVAPASPWSGARRALAFAERPAGTAPGASCSSAAFSSPPRRPSPGRESTWSPSGKWPAVTRVRSACPAGKSPTTRPGWPGCPRASGASSGARTRSWASP